MKASCISNTYWGVSAMGLQLVSSVLSVF